MIEDLVHEWRSAGMEEGDIVLVHSSIKRTFRRYFEQGKKLTPQLILESLLESVGESGTLLLPLYNFGFAAGEPFDMQTRPPRWAPLPKQHDFTLHRLERGINIFVCCNRSLR